MARYISEGAHSFSPREKVPAGRMRGGAPHESHRIPTPPRIGVGRVGPTKTLLEAANRAGLPLDAPCNGAGTCGKCRVKVEPKYRSRLREAAHEFLTDDERKAGWLLACQTEIHGDLGVDLSPVHSSDMNILKDGCTAAVEIDPWIKKSFEKPANATKVFGGRAIRSV